MNYKKLALGLALLPSVVFAQAATISRTDIGPSLTSKNLTTGMQNAATSMWFSNDGNTLFALKGGGTGISATFKTQKSSLTKEGYGTVALTDEAIDVPSGTIVIAGPFPTGRWNTAGGTVAVSLTTATGVSATSFRPND